MKIKAPNFKHFAITAEYFLPLIDAALPDNEKRRLIDLLQKDMKYTPKKPKHDPKLVATIIKHVTKSQKRNNEKGPNS